MENDKNNSIKPEYYSRFTIQKLVDGAFKTLDYEYVMTKSLPPGLTRSQVIE